MVFFLALALGPGAAAFALSGGTGPVEPVAGSPWASVGSLDVAGRLFSGVLIDRRHVLTAAHVVAGAAPSQVVFRTPLAGGFVSGAVAVHVHPGYRGNATQNPPGDPSMHADLAVVRLARPAPVDLPLAGIYRGPLLGRTLQLVSHGGSTTLITMGENQVEHVFLDAAGRPATYLFVVAKHDPVVDRSSPQTPSSAAAGPRRETGLVSGDSGSAAFVNVDGRWWLAGINTFQVNFADVAAAGMPRSGGGGVVLSESLAWMQAVVSLPEAPPAESAASGVRRANEGRGP